MPHLKVSINFVNRKGQYAPMDARNTVALLGAWAKANKTRFAAEPSDLKGYRYSIEFDGHGRDLALALRSHLMNEKLAADAESVDITP